MDCTWVDLRFLTGQLHQLLVFKKQDFSSPKKKKSQISCLAYATKPFLQSHAIQKKTYKSAACRK